MTTSIQKNRAENHTLRLPSLASSSTSKLTRRIWLQFKNKQELKMKSNEVPRLNSEFINRTRAYTTGQSHTSFCHHTRKRLLNRFKALPGNQHADTHNCELIFGGQPRKKVKFASDANRNQRWPSHVMMWPFTSDYRHFKYTRWWNVSSSTPGKTHTNDEKLLLFN